MNHSYLGSSLELQRLRKDLLAKIAILNKYISTWRTRRYKNQDIFTLFVPLNRSRGGSLNFSSKGQGVSQLHCLNAHL